MSHTLLAAAFFENIPRIIPKGLGVRIDLGSWEMPPIFKLLVREASMMTDDAYKTFNMGIGMVLAVSPFMVTDILAASRELGEKSFVIGTVQEGQGCGAVRIERLVVMVSGGGTKSAGLFWTLVPMDVYRPRVAGVISSKPEVFAL